MCTKNEDDNKKKQQVVEEEKVDDEEEEKRRIQETNCRCFPSCSPGKISRRRMLLPPPIMLAR